jgi:uncharacterized protein
MISRPYATLNLASLLKRSPLEGDEVAGEGLLEPSSELLLRSGVKVAAPLEWRLAVRATGGEEEFLLEGEVAGTAVLECRRCLSEVETEIETAFLYPMVYRPGAKGLVLRERDDEDSEEVLVFGQPEVDFADVLVEMFALDLPLTVLCRAECKGLSSEGINLNEHPEAEKIEVRKQDSPFSALKDFEV